MIPLWIRLFHAVIASLVLLLILSGLTQHFATVDWAIMDYYIATVIHEWGGITFAIVLAVFLMGLLFTGHWRTYGGRGGRFRRLAWWQSQFLGRNPWVLFGLMPVIAVTGLVYLYPSYYLPPQVLGWDGRWTIAMAHYLASALGVVYTLGHIFMAFFMGLWRRVLFGRLRFDRQKP